MKTAERTRVERTAPRGPRVELDERTAHGGVYARRLRRAQLGLALLSLTAFGGLVGSLLVLLDHRFLVASPAGLEERSSDDARHVGPSLIVC